jgi:hypothetical protein
VWSGVFLSVAKTAIADFNKSGSHLAIYSKIGTSLEELSFSGEARNKGRTPRLSQE